jgi:hypothetical protein
MAKKDTKKKNDDWAKTATRVFVVFILISCILGFTLTMGFFNIFKKAEEGSIVAIEYTIRDETGIPIITSDTSVVETEGVLAGVSQPIQFIVNQTYDDFIVPVEVYIYPSGVINYALFEPEMQAISDGVIGLGEGDSKTIYFPFGSSMEREMTKIQYENIGGNFSEAEIGMWIPLGFAPQPEITVENATPETIATRYAKITSIGDESLNVLYGYAGADIRVTAIA